MKIGRVPAPPPVMVSPFFALSAPLAAQRKKKQNRSLPVSNVPLLNPQISILTHPFFRVLINLSVHGKSVHYFFNFDMFFFLEIIFGLWIFF